CSLISRPPPSLHSLSLPDALPICCPGRSSLSSVPIASAERHDAVHDALGELDQAREHEGQQQDQGQEDHDDLRHKGEGHLLHLRSEEHTSELQSRENLVCRLLLEK